MKTLATVIATLAPATAFAATNAPAGGNGIFFWIFVGLCAIIGIAQAVH